MNLKRRSKVDLINISDDDSASEQPPVKSKKKEEVVELQKKVMELEEKLAKSEKTSQGAIRIAGEAQARVKFLENLIDTKPYVLDCATNKEREDQLEKKVCVLTKQLDEERLRHRMEKERGDSLEKRIDELTAKREGMPRHTVPPHLMQQDIPAAESPTQHPTEVQHPLPQATKTIRVRFSDISKIGKHKVYSDPTEFAGINWRISVAGKRSSNRLNFALNGEKDNEIGWSSIVNANIQFFSQKTNEMIPRRTFTGRFHKVNNYSHFLETLSFEKLNDSEFLIDDSVTVAVVLRVLLSN